jgi:hypothetical protein
MHTIADINKKTTSIPQENNISNEGKIGKRKMKSSNLPQEKNNDIYS